MIPKKTLPLFSLTILLGAVVFLGHGFAQQGLLNDLDQHIDQFDPFPEATIVSEPEVVEELPEIELPTNLDDIKQDIFWEESDLDAVEQKLRETEIQLWQQQGEQEGIEQQIHLLDQALVLNKEQLDLLTDQERKSKARLEELTWYKSDIEALLRVKKREFEKIALHAFLRTDQWQGRAEPNLEPSRKLFLVRWLFSDRSLSEVLKDHYDQEAVKENQEQLLAELSSLQKELIQRERVFARQYTLSARLSQQVATQKKNLTDFTNAKAELRQRLDLDNRALAQKQQEYRTQQAESTQLLQSLRQQLVSVRDGKVSVFTTEPAAEVSQGFSLPVDPPIRVTAHFHDYEYEQRFGLRHDGTDFAAPQSSPIYSINEGVVVKVKDNGLGYSFLIVEHPGGLFSLYGHVSSFLVEEGQSVDSGERIALSGGTPGTSGAGFFTTGPHLHLEMFRNGKYIDPLSVLPRE